MLEPLTWRLARAIGAVTLAVALAACNATAEGPGAAGTGPIQEAEPRTKDVEGTGYAISVPRSWVKLTARDATQLKVKKADLAVADRPRGCTSNVGLVAPESRPTVQGVAVTRHAATTSADASCALRGHRQLVFVTRAANVPPVTTSTAEQQIRQVFGTLGPDLDYATRPRVDIDQIEGAHVVATGRNRTGQQVRLDGVVAYSNSNLYSIFVMQLGKDSRAQARTVSDLLESWVWR